MTLWLRGRLREPPAETVTGTSSRTRSSRQTLSLSISQYTIVRSGGNGELSLDLTIVYCEIDKESVCLLDRVRLEVPVTVSAGGSRSLPLSHRVNPGS